MPEEIQKNILSGKTPPEKLDLKISGIAINQTSINIDKCNKVLKNKEDLWLEWEIIIDGKLDEPKKNALKFALKNNELIILPDQMYPCQISKIKFE